MTSRQKAKIEHLEAQKRGERPSLEKHAQIKQKRKAKIAEIEAATNTKTSVMPKSTLYLPRDALCAFPPVTAISWDIIYSLFRSLDWRTFTYSILERCALIWRRGICGSDIFGLVNMLGEDN
jgi:hypothetical protein